jgi:hypothetical protein
LLLPNKLLSSLLRVFHIAAETVHLVSLEAPLGVLQSIEGRSRIGGGRVPGTRSRTAHVRSGVFKASGRVRQLLVVGLTGEAFELAGGFLGLFGQLALVPVTGAA